MTTKELLLTAWDADPFAIALSLAALVLYGVVLRRQVTSRAGYFAGAVAVFALALVSPLGVLARGYLFSAHMLQHLLLVLIVPPLVLLALPAENTPHAAREGAPTKSATHTAARWIAGVGVMWIWHAPTLCDAAGQSVALQRVQTLSLLAMGAAFWWPIFAPRARARLAPFAAMLYLFTACSACTLLGVLVTFAPAEPCSIYAHPVDTLGAMPLLRDRWGLGPKADQEVGGLLMWVPACFVYASAILAMLARYYREEDPPVPERPQAAALVKESL